LVSGKGIGGVFLDCLLMVILEKISEYLVATTVLHNICILNKDLLDIDVVLNQHIQRGRLTLGRIDNGNRKRG